MFWIWGAGLFGAVFGLFALKWFAVGLLQKELSVVSTFKKHKDGYVYVYWDVEMKSWRFAKPKRNMAFMKYLRYERANVNKHAFWVETGKAVKEFDNLCQAIDAFKASEEARELAQEALNVMVEADDDVTETKKQDFGHHKFSEPLKKANEYDGYRVRIGNKWVPRELLEDSLYDSSEFIDVLKLPKKKSK